MQFDETTECGGRTMKKGQRGRRGGEDRDEPRLLIDWCKDIMPKALKLIDELKMHLIRQMEQVIPISFCWLLTGRKTR